MCSFSISVILLIVYFDAGSPAALSVDAALGQSGVSIISFIEQPLASAVVLVTSLDNLKKTIHSIE